MANKAKHAFGSEANVDTALQNGTLDAYDILFLDEKKIGWINRDGEKVILEPPKEILFLEELPEQGEPDVLYVLKTSPRQLAIWNGDSYDLIMKEVTDEMIQTKIDNALEIVEF